MIITDHINLFPTTFNRPNIDEFGPRFPDMSEAIPKMVQLAEDIAAKMKYMFKKVFMQA